MTYIPTIKYSHSHSFKMTHFTSLLKRYVDTDVPEEIFWRAVAWETETDSHLRPRYIQVILERIKGYYGDGSHDALLKILDIIEKFTVDVGLPLLKQTLENNIRDDADAFMLEAINHQLGV